MQNILSVTHDAYWTGTHWLHDSMKPELQERATCNECGKIDDFRHILTECESPGQALIWELAGSLWEKKGGNIPWSFISLGDVLGCGLARTKANRLQIGESRLWKILISESAYLIWTLRCERAIANEGRPFNAKVITNKWVRMINDRLELDRRMTHHRYGTKALANGLVIHTWRGTLMNEENLPKDWTKESGVLVSITGGQNEEVSGVG
ncbi:hypothetical protein BT96DRAFT_1074859 [Gymnopus androsaceus JB14]|uniref:Reverse transcriptase zinc-binding domain-containing protein n=1 Tax=Gymnopus androsaceus JB14 TaxID=1447944 RepID=A0A6A4GST8_9AGAR|nr:hypothetical protein BT96DRAFT_1074859 [Gymnopus androsaceus JB14]